MDNKLILKLSEIGYEGEFTLDALIKKCGDILLYKIPHGKWVAVSVNLSEYMGFTEDYVNHIHHAGYTGDKPIDAVARLYLDIKQ